MALSNSSHPYKIYVSTLPRNYGFKDDQSLKSPMITFKCNVKMSYVPDKPDKSIKAYIQDHDAWHEFERPADELTGFFLSTTMFSSTTIPFELRNLHWKRQVHDKESVPLTSTVDIATSMLEVCKSMVSEEARKSSRKKLCLLVFVKKEVIVPYKKYLLMLKARKEEEVLQQLQDMIRLRAEGWNFGQSDWENMTNAVRQAELGDSIRSALALARRRATRESRERAMARTLKPAAATSIEALEKVTLMSNGSNTEEKCTVCMEEMPMGSQVTRMPCSHVFHGPCIEEWLKISHMCPLCRFKLTTD